MDYFLFVAFLSTTLFFVVTPGPSVAFASAQAIKHGPRAMLITVAGDALGTAVHIAVAASSLTALMALSALVLPFLQILGGLFILVLAYQSLRDTKNLAKPSRTITAKASFWSGFFACVTNPKAIVFFVALFPAFISPDHSIFLQTVVYGAIFLLLDAISIVGYSTLAMHAVKRTTARWLNIDILGAIGLFGVGIAMVIKGYKSLPNT